MIVFMKSVVYIVVYGVRKGTVLYFSIWCEVGRKTKVGIRSLQRLCSVQCRTIKTFIEDGGSKVFPMGDEAISSNSVK